MKSIATLLILILAIKVYGQTATFDPCSSQDTIKFEKIWDIKRINDPKELEGISILDTLKSPFGIIFEMKGGKYIAIKNKDNWEYWHIEGPGRLSKESIVRIDIDNKENPELLLTLEYADGRYNWGGGFSVQGQTVLIYNLDKKMLMLRLDTSYSDEHSYIEYFNERNENINIDSLYTSSEGINVDSLTESFTSVINNVWTKSSCQYYFSKNTLKLEYSCEETTSEEPDKPIPSKGIKYYRIESDKFVVKK